MAKPGIILGGDLNIVKPNTEIDASFLALTISNGRQQKELSKKAQGKSVVHLHNSDLKEVNLVFPQKEEQTEIGHFFRQLDATITLHQDAIQHQQDLKKAMLQKLFSVNGARIPTVRFATFKEEWEQRKLGELIISEIKGKAKANMSGTNAVYLDANYLNGGKTYYVDAPVDVEADDVLILWDGSQAGTVYHGFVGCLGSTLKAFKPKESGSFLYQILVKNQQIIYNSYRTPNIPHVIKTFTSEFEIRIPLIEEQQKIGDFFKNLDDTIALHQQALDKLKLLKQSLLQKMFV